MVKKLAITREIFKGDHNAAAAGTLNNWKTRYSNIYTKKSSGDSLCLKLVGDICSLK